MIKHTRWNECQRVRINVMAGRLWDCLKNKEMRCKNKRIERGETGEDIRREGGEMVGTKVCWRKEKE